MPTVLAHNCRDARVGGSRLPGQVSRQGGKRDPGAPAFSVEGEGAGARRALRTATFHAVDHCMVGLRRAMEKFMI